MSFNKNSKNSRNKRIAILALAFGKGYGVGMVAASQARFLASHGYHVDIFTCIPESYHQWENIQVYRVPLSVPYVQSCLQSGAYDFVIAHTDPFFDLLPGLKGTIRIAFEHGDPDPDFFEGEDREHRWARKKHKQDHVYPNIDHVIAISDFIRRDIDWGDSEILYNGGDHFVSGKTLPTRTVSDADPLRILCVGRIGKQEAEYKGYKDLVRLQQDLGPRYQVILAGRGSAEDCAFYRDQGIEVEANLSDEELLQLYHSCDIFVSFSRWEGFNLPLIEAAVLGRPALALELGAHPEVATHCFAEYDSLKQWIKVQNRQSLLDMEHSLRTHAEKFTWEKNHLQLLAMLEKWAVLHQQRRLGSPGIQHGLLKTYFRIRELIRPLLLRLCGKTT